MIRKKDTSPIVKHYFNRDIHKLMYYLISLQQLDDYYICTSSDVDFRNYVKSTVGSYTLTADEEQRILNWILDAYIGEFYKSSSEYLSKQTKYNDRVYLMFHKDKYNKNKGDVL